MSQMSPVFNVSGKLTFALVKMWFQIVFLPSTSDKSVLLLNSWSGQISKTLEPIMEDKEYLKIHTIPAETIGKIQPLDVFFFSGLGKISFDISPT